MPASEIVPTDGTFVLGMGAQKAGTTWLSDYLRSSDEFERGYRKEYHVLDTVDLPEAGRRMRRRNLRMARGSLDAFEAGRPADADVLHRMAMCADLTYYYDYFVGLLRRPKIRATGDLTPEHALLSPSRLASVRDEFAARGVHTVAVFLMRDPVERIWSHIRMRADRTPEVFDHPLETEMLENHHAANYSATSRYETTLDALDAAFDPRHVHLGLYEDLFHSGDQARSICDLLAIEAPEPRLGQRRNAASQPSHGLSVETRRTVAQHFASTYSAVSQRCPELDIERWWPHAQLSR